MKSWVYRRPSFVPYQRKFVATVAIGTDPDPVTPTFAPPIARSIHRAAYVRTRFAEAYIMRAKTRFGLTSPSIPSAELWSSRILFASTFRRAQAQVLANGRYRR